MHLKIKFKFGTIVNFNKNKLLHGHQHKTKIKLHMCIHVALIQRIKIRFSQDHVELMKLSYLVGNHRAKNSNKNSGFMELKMVCFP